MKLSGGENMGLYLNLKNDNFISYYNDDIFVDKSMIISKVNDSLNKASKKFMCVTRPRRFGKTLALSMLNAYYSKGCDSREIFKDLKISKDSSFEKHLNKHNVIWIDMASVYTSIRDKSMFFDELEGNLIDSLKETFPQCITEKEDTIGKCLVRINSMFNETFIFLIDEWDVIYREQENNRKLCDEYTEFLRSLFKSSDVSACIDLVYMTGILPIRRYSTQSTLNMFREYNMLDSANLTEFIGFTEKEVKELCTEYNRNFDEIKNWYDGYKLNGIEIYNPKSVVEAITYGECADYWVQTSATEAVSNYMNYDHGVMKDLITDMIAGEKVPVDTTMFENDLTQVNSKDAALTVLIHLGYLAYDKENKSCYIPNHEIKQEFITALKKLDWTEIYNPISGSRKLYEETLKGNTEFINATLDKNHKELAGPFNKNKEDVLGIIVEISYYNAQKYYVMKKEETSTLGRSDISFIPKDSTHIPFIIELKADSSPEDAISQIREKEYFSSLAGYKGKVLLLGISYDSRKLKHSSKVEFIEL
jgi:hypothetical protein